MTMGKKLIALRGEKTQQEVAESIGITVQALSNYESGKRNPRDDIKVSLSKYYGVDLGWLFYAIEVNKMNTNGSN